MEPRAEVPQARADHLAATGPGDPLQAPRGLPQHKEIINDIESLDSAQDLGSTPPEDSELAVERSASDELEQHLAQLEAAPGDHPQALLQTLPTLLRVAARQLQPQQLEQIAQRIASLALAEPADEMASFLGCETALLARRYPAAMDLCQDYLRRFPQGPRARDVAFLAASTARLQLGDCARAVPLYDQALTFSGVLQSYNDEAYLGRARCRQQLGDAAGARSDLSLFLFKYPERRRDRELRSLLEQLQLDR
jgi:TolA-binding protein